MLKKIPILFLLLFMILALCAGCSSKNKDDADSAAASEASAEESSSAADQAADQDAEPDAIDLEDEDIAREDIENPSTLIEKFSYAMGVYVSDVYGTEYATDYFALFQAYYLPELDSYFGYLGIYDYTANSLLYSFDELNQIIEEYYADYDMRMAAFAEENLAEAEAFLSENATKEGIFTTGSGLQYEIIRQGNGPMAGEDDSVELDYELKLMDGTVIDSSYERGEHSTFPLSGVIAGFREGVMLMPMGSHYVFYIHPSLGYGDQATGSMDPNSLLIFNVETYSIEGE